MIYAVAAESTAMPRQLFSIAPGLRGRTAWQPQMSNLAALPAMDPALQMDPQEATVGVWESPHFVIASQHEVEPPESSIVEMATVLLCAMAGAAVGYAARMRSQDHGAIQPSVAMLGVGGQAATSQEMAKTAWLAKLDAPTWGTATSEEAAKTAWLAKLDAPTWGTAATALAGIASEAAYVADMTEACDDGDEVACDSLSREDEAKRAWLAKLDVPTWGAAAAAVSAVAGAIR